MASRDRAQQLLREWKGESYAFGTGALDCIGRFAGELGTRGLVVADPSPWLAPTVEAVLESLRGEGVDVCGDRAWRGARPNTPREDVYRIESSILRFDPDCVAAIGGGSGIDAAKAANVLATLGDVDDDIEAYLGVGLVSQALQKAGRQLKPLVAVQTASGSAAHLTKYSNITDPLVGQKKLIVDPAIIPPRAVFEYAVTSSAPAGLTVDGALDSIAHSLEVLYGIGESDRERVQEIALLTIELVLESAPAALANPSDSVAREGLGLASDLGGYAIMVGGTNGGHLTSFSLVDATTDDRACAIMNPYYTVFFATAVEDRVRAVGDVYRRAGYLDADPASLGGRALGEAVAGGMIAFSKSIGMPTTLAELPGFTDAHIDRALTAAKSPQLRMKLQNMPVPLDACLVDEFMAPVLDAARTGDLGRVRSMG